MLLLPASIHRAALSVLIVWLAACPALADENPAPKPLDSLLPLLTAVSGKAEQFAISASVSVSIDGANQQIDGRLVRYDAESFDLDLTHPDYAIALRRRRNVTVLALPKHQVAYVGRGEVDSADRLTCTGAWQRIVSADSKLAPVPATAGLLANLDPAAVVSLLTSQGLLNWNRETESWEAGDVSVRGIGNGRLLVMSPGVTGSVDFELNAPEPPDATDWPSFRSVELSRDELERTLLRGVRRATEVLLPGDSLTQPEQRFRAVSNGTLQWIGGQRVATLWGTPAQIGTAHGQLLRDESRRCIESVMYSFATAHVIQTGRWFRHDLEQAYARLESHIPERHKTETHALAMALEMPPDDLEVLNVFPELFHCSGFAVFASATSDGKLYHGRVLDYMTTIGLQDSATTFIVRPDGLIPFANVGYGGFIGSVSGMNSEAISLGEMGGRGEGNWDGVPMATLMRRALEECRTLDEVKTLWQNSPRTCEYYFVFADGKTHQAVGVAATPDTIQFVNPGEGHELLGEGIKDAVVLSAGSRLEELRRRVQSKHGRINADTAMWLMSRPVAMQSNLHNVLFIPEDRILHVANAGHNKPAAEMPYVRLDLTELLNAVPENNATVEAAATR